MDEQLVLLMTQFGMSGVFVWLYWLERSARTSAQTELVETLKVVAGIKVLQEGESSTPLKSRKVPPSPTNH